MKKGFNFLKELNAIVFIIAIAAVLLFASCNRDNGASLSNEDFFRVMPRDNGKSLEIIRYTGNKQSVNIPSRLHGMPVTRIGDGVFSGKELITVTIPNGITEIGNRAFLGNMLTIVTIPNSVTTIGNNAFRDNNLTKITIGSKVTFIGEYAFRDNQLVNVTIPNSVINIEAGAFMGAWDDENNQPLGTITSVSIGNSVTTIGDKAFENNAITSVKIPNKTAYIGEFSFADNRITSVNIPASVTFIGGMAFAANPLANVSIDANNTKYAVNGSYIMSKDGKQTVWYFGTEKNVTIPDGVITIGDRSFAGNQLSSVSIPESVTTIMSGAFKDNKINAIVLPNSVQSIGLGAFSGNQISRITIGSNVQGAENINSRFGDQYNRDRNSYYYYDGNAFAKAAGTYIQQGRDWTAQTER